MAAVLIASERPVVARRARPSPAGRASRPSAAVQPCRPSAAVYRRRRTVALGLVGAAVLAGWVGVHDLVAGDRLGPSQDIAAHVVVVAPGDTLWSIAASSGVKGDLRPLVDELSAEVHGQPLQVGERITVP